MKYKRGKIPPGGGSEPPLGEIAGYVRVFRRAHPVVGDPLAAALADVAGPVERPDVKRPEVTPVNLVVVPERQKSNARER